MIQPMRPFSVRASEMYLRETKGKMEPNTTYKVLALVEDRYGKIFVVISHYGFSRQVPVRLLDIVDIE